MRMNRARPIIGLLTGWLLPLLAGCQTPPPSVPALPSAESAAMQDAGPTFYVAGNGWHSAVIVARDDLPQGAIPEAADFPHARYIAFGWGDAAYYPAPQPTFLMTLYAGLLPSPAVVHLKGLADDPRAVYPNADIVAMRPSAAGFRRLIAYLHATFDRGGAGRAGSLAPARHLGGLFYPATGTFHMFNTCNSWTAGAVRAAGWRIEAEGTLVADGLMAKLRPLSIRALSTATGGKR